MGNTMTVYHTSPEKIESIHTNGALGECLCFSTLPYTMTAKADADIYVYALEIDERDIIDVEDLYHLPQVVEIADLLGVSVEDAEKILDGSEDIPPQDDGGAKYGVYMDYAELSWAVQGLQGLAARGQGYEAVWGRDEQGSVLIVPMLDREKDLKLIRAPRIDRFHPDTPHNTFLGQ